MDVNDIKTLLGAVAEADVSELVLETGDYKLTVKRGSEPQYISLPASDPQSVQATAPASQPAAPPAAATPAPEASPAAPATSKFVEVAAPIVGTFYAAPAPDVSDFVKVGDRVEAGAVLCIIEAMKLMNEIEAETAGIIKEILVKNEDPVEYGQVLFRIDPS